MGDYLNTKLDADQVLRRAYDEADNRLRVDAEVTAVISSVDVIINAATDNIAISDGTDFLAINADGSINVNVSDIVISAANDSIKIGDGTDFLAINADGSINVNFVETGTLVNTYNEVLSVASAVLTTITSFTATQTTKLKQVDVSGENIASYEVLVNGSVVAKKRTYFGAELNESFVFDKGIEFTVGQIVLVRVIHNRPSTANFNANIITIEG